VFKPYEDNVKRIASTKVLSFFDISARNFGERIRVDELNRLLFEIPEVRFSKLTNLTDDIKLDINEIIQLNNVEFTVEYV
jgi:FAD synthase